jgi:hypothetical protein
VNENLAIVKKVISQLISSGYQNPKIAITKNSIVVFSLVIEKISTAQFMFRNEKVN